MARLKAEADQELTSNWSMRQRAGETFENARQSLIKALVHSLSNRFDSPEIIQAMHIANFMTWPLPDEMSKIEGIF